MPKYLPPCILARLLNPRLDLADREPLAPRILAPILEEPLPAFAASRDTRFRIYADLDSHAWEVFSEGECRTLGEMVARRLLSQYGSPALRRIAGCEVGAVDAANLDDLSI